MLYAPNTFTLWENEMLTILDIGAGGCSFAKALRRANPLLRRTARFVCGEPDYTRRFDPTLGAGWIQEIQASYQNFNMPDESLDLVTLNAQHPVFSDSRIEAELLRTLKRGGYFMSAHPVRIHPSLNSRHFKVVLFKDPSGKELDELPFEGASFFKRPRVRCSTHFLPDGESLVYPASGYIWNRLLVCRAVELNVEFDGSNYVYRGRSEYPSLKVWVRV